MFSDVFAELMAKNNTNPLRVAKEIGVPKSIVYEWKKGEREPSVENIQKLADHFGVSIEYLLDRQGSYFEDENELILMLRTAKSISDRDYEKMVSDFKQSIDRYIKSRSEKETK